ncbi:MAG: tryptophan synthase subunit alpha [Acidimicrobiales bacterium]
MKNLEVDLRRVRDGGRKALVPYFVAGLTPDWVRYVEAAVHAGADAVEIGVPFSDPMMDGVVIQEGALHALEAGTTLDSLCSDLASLSATVPLVAMTYYNIVHHYGLERCAGKLHESGIGGAIVPDLSLEEADPWRGACAERDVATIFLVAPSTPPQRVARVAGASEGFVYAQARMAVTGEAADIGQAQRVVAAVRDVCDIPTYVGIGITTPEQAREAARDSDGVIIGSAIVRRILDGASVEEVERFVAAFRDALD